MRVIEEIDSAVIESVATDFSLWTAFDDDDIPLKFLFELHSTYSVFQGALVFVL